MIVFRFLRRIPGVKVGASACESVREAKRKEANEKRFQAKEKRMKRIEILHFVTRVQVQYDDEKAGQKRAAEKLARHVAKMGCDSVMRNDYGTVSAKAYKMILEKR